MYVVFLFSYNAVTYGEDTGKKGVKIIPSITFCRYRKISYFCPRVCLLIHLQAAFGSNKRGSQCQWRQQIAIKAVVNNTK